jgi:hypothetical protein
MVGRRSCDCKTAGYNKEEVRGLRVDEIRSWQQRGTATAMNVREAA